MNTQIFSVEDFAAVNAYAEVSLQGEIVTGLTGPELLRHTVGGEDVYVHVYVDLPGSSRRYIGRLLTQDGQLVVKAYAKRKELRFAGLSR